MASRSQSFESIQCDLQASASNVNTGNHKHALCDAVLLKSDFSKFDRIALRYAAAKCSHCVDVIEKFDRNPSENDYFGCWNLKNLVFIIQNIF